MRQTRLSSLAQGGDIRSLEFLSLCVALISHERLSRTSYPLITYHITQVPHLRAEEVRRPSRAELRFVTHKKKEYA